MKYLKIAAVTIILIVLHLLIGNKDLFIQDLFFKIRGPIKHSDDIRIAAIDNVSINVTGNWPWSRVNWRTSPRTGASSETVSATMSRAPA